MAGCRRSVQMAVARAQLVETSQSMVILERQNSGVPVTELHMNGLPNRILFAIHDLESAFLPELQSAFQKRVRVQVKNVAAISSGFLFERMEQLRRKP